MTRCGPPSRAGSRQHDNRIDDAGELNSLESSLDPPQLYAILTENLMSTVTSAEAQKNFGRYREQALAEPVVVTQYGKPSVVIISAAEYERLKELDRRVMRLDDMSDAEIEEMLNSRIPPEHRYSISDIKD
jgi:prevent-host-death family protein